MSALAESTNAAQADPAVIGGKIQAPAAKPTPSEFNCSNCKQVTQSVMPHVAERWAVEGCMKCPCNVNVRPRPCVPVLPSAFVARGRDPTSLPPALRPRRRHR